MEFLILGSFIVDLLLESIHKYCEFAMISKKEINIRNQAENKRLRKKAALKSAEQ
jgi:hypothetical protein